MSAFQSVLPSSDNKITLCDFVERIQNIFPLCKLFYKQFFKKASQSTVELYSQD